MNPKKKMRLLSLLLCFVMLFSLLPTTALAAEPSVTTISELSVTVAEPVAGQLASAAPVADGEGYTVVYFEWIDVAEEAKLYPEDGDT